MSISGDLEVTLKRVVEQELKINLNDHQVKIILIAILDCVADPNFAYRFARENAVDDSEKERTKSLCDYWDVIKFLKGLVI